MIDLPPTQQKVVLGVPCKCGRWRVGVPGLAEPETMHVICHHCGTEEFLDTILAIRLIATTTFEVA